MIARKVRHRTKVGKRNQVTIPAEILRALGVKPGEQVELTMRDGTAWIAKAGDPVEYALGLLKRDVPKALDSEQLDGAITTSSEAAATARYRRSAES